MYEWATALLQTDKLSLSLLFDTTQSETPQCVMFCGCVRVCWLRVSAEHMSKVAWWRPKTLICYLSNEGLFQSPFNHLTTFKWAFWFKDMLIIYNFCLDFSEIGNFKWNLKYSINNSAVFKMTKPFAVETPSDWTYQAHFWNALHIQFELELFRIDFRMKELPSIY